ncbi:MAG: S41 family peptidase [Bacteroidia bacterium]|nr:S41 family peptidase [Bacteroidia bacterium]
MTPSHLSPPAHLIMFLMLFVAAAGAQPLATRADVDNDGKRLLRFPDIHRDAVVFVHAGDIYTVSANGGTARQLTSHEGQELFPKFSPDGKWIAFSAEYSGSRQIYVMPSEGGTPRQLTWYNDAGVMPPRGGFDHQVLGWTPDGTRILFRANRLPWDERLSRFYTIPFSGGLETPLIIPEGGMGEFGPDGKRMVYTPISREWRTWKRTRGGRAQDVWLFDLEKVSAERLTDHIMTDNQPMWIGDTLYFTSDREFTLNLFAMDLNGKTVRRVTQHDTWDVLWPSSGPDAIIYECGGELHVYETRSGSSRQLRIGLRADGRETLPGIRSVSDFIEGTALSPSAKRVIMAARGDLFSVPAEHGEIRNLTGTQGVRERAASWSPDGKTIAYVSDQSGEYEIWLRPADNTSPARQLTSGSRGWIFSVQWSPDGRRIAFADKARGLCIADVATGAVRELVRGRRYDITHFRWSPDSRWLVYTDVAPSDLNGIWVYDTEKDTPLLLSSGMSNDFNPVFSRDGKYMFFLSNRDFNLTFSAFEFRYLYTNATRVYAAALHPEVPAFRPWRSDEEGGPASADTARAPKVRISAEGFADRVVALPVSDATYFSLEAGEGAVLYIRIKDGQRALLRYDIAAQKEETVFDGIGGYELSRDGKSILYAAGGSWGIVAVRAGQKKGDGALNLARMDMRIDPRLEWRQMFSDAWRIMRDWFYDPAMHGYDWDALRGKYASLLPALGRRSDLDFIIGEMISELNAGHTYVNSGDEHRVKRIEGGLLGCEFEDAGNRYYRIGKVFEGENWHEAFRSPLTEHGVNVRAGDYLIAVDDKEIVVPDNPFRFLENTHGRTVKVTVNTRPSPEGARNVMVRPVKSETNVRFLDWVKRNMAWVDSASGGRIGYIWIPNTAAEGNRELFKWFYPQANKQALILDDRYNGGGFIPYNMIELLDRQALNYWARRNIEPMSAPDVFHRGPKVCLINHYSSSGGDAFPYYFKKRGLGQLIGTRTWGGLIGLTGQPNFVDGGSVSVPTFRFYDPEGNWVIENEGVSPDIEVIDRPDLVARGIDPSLQKAVEVLLRELQENPVRPVPRPVPPDESRPGSR